MRAATSKRSSSGIFSSRKKCAALSFETAQPFNADDLLSTDYETAVDNAPDEFRVIARHLARLAESTVAANDQRSFFWTRLRKDQS